MSKTLRGILVPVELEVAREPAAESAKTLQRLFALRLARDATLPGVCDTDLDLIDFMVKMMRTELGWLLSRPGR